MKNFPRCARPYVNDFLKKIELIYEKIFPLRGLKGYENPIRKKLFYLKKVPVNFPRCARPYVNHFHKKIEFIYEKIFPLRGLKG